MAEEPAKTHPRLFSHPGINSQAGLCLQCYIYMEQPYGIGIFLLTAALLSSKQRREGLLQNNTCCISVFLQTPSQVQRRQLLQCNASTSHHSQGLAGGTCCHLLPGMPQTWTSTPMPGEAQLRSRPITHLSVLWRWRTVCKQSTCVFLRSSGGSHLF